MGASLRAEALALRKRPAIRLLALLPVVVVLLVGYAAQYLMYRSAASGGLSYGASADMQLAVLQPDHVVRTVMNLLGELGAAIALILGALVAGSDYGWGTLKTALTQRPTRLATYLGKVLALAVVVTLLVLATYGGSLAASVLIAATAGGSVAWPTWDALATGMGDLWLIVAMWAAGGALLATLARGTALAIGLGLGWLFAVEGIVNLLANQVAAVKAVYQAFPGANTLALVVQFGDDGGHPVAGVPARADLAPYILAAYSVAFLAAAAVLFCARDVA